MRQALVPYLGRRVLIGRRQTRLFGRPGKQAQPGARRASGPLAPWRLRAGAETNGAEQKSLRPARRENKGELEGAPSSLSLGVKIFLRPRATSETYGCWWRGPAALTKTNDLVAGAPELTRGAAGPAGLLSGPAACMKLAPARWRAPIFLKYNSLVSQGRKMTFTFNTSRFFISPAARRRQHA